MKYLTSHAHHDVARQNPSEPMNSDLTVARA